MGREEKEAAKNSRARRKRQPREAMKGAAHGQRWWWKTGPSGAPACDVLHVRRRAEVDRGHDLDVGGLVASCMVAILVLAARVSKLPEARVWGWSSGVGLRRGRGRGRNRDSTLPRYPQKLCRAAPGPADRWTRRERRDIVFAGEEERTDFNSGTGTPLVAWG